MKKYLIFTLLITLLFSLVACSSNPSYIHGTPKNAIFNAPDEFYLEWDIPSVRDIKVSKEGHYSMPVYMFETYDELLHLKEIVGMQLIGSEIDNTDYCPICYSSEECEHDFYNEQFFEKYTLLIGWCQYAGIVIPDHVDQSTQNPSADEPIDEPEDAPSDNTSDDTLNGGEHVEDIPSDPQNEPIVAEYKIAPDGALTVYLKGEKSETDATKQWIFVSVPKSVMADCDSIAFLVELPE
jgi:hypothetical protein